jgi:hypothetical protein
MSIGVNESLEDVSFTRRPKPPYTLSNCPDIGRKYQWAELKSSLLMKYLVHDTNVQKELVSWLHTLIRLLFTFLAVDSRPQFAAYMRDLPISVQKDTVESYPVGQVKAWIGDSEGGWNNFYVLFNFIKWTWYKLVHGKFYDSSLCQKRPIYAFLFIELFQQKILIFHDMIRGNRLNLHGGHRSDQIGITNLTSPFLKREVRGKPAYATVPWEHPGQVQCRVPYRGKYGTYIKEFREQDSFYASLQCGISGSVQYILFMYLLSLFGAAKVPANPDADVRNMITSACLILTGDGGHNVREVIFGFTCSIIIMHTFMEQLRIEIDEANKTSTPGSPSYGILLRTIKKYLVEKLPTIPCTRIVGTGVNHEIFIGMINSVLTQWVPFINAAYRLTSQINIVGVYASDLNAFNPVILQAPAKSYQDMKKWFFEELFYKGDKFAQIHNLKNYNQVQIFFALEGNRYLLNPMTSFKSAANIEMDTIVKNFPKAAESNIFGKVNTAMLLTLQNCEKKKEITPSLEKKIGGDPRNIPLASPRRASCATCSSDAKVVVGATENEQGYCVDCAANSLKESSMSPIRSRSKKYRWMSYSSAAKHIPEAKDRGVSKVARGRSGFMGVYKRAGSSKKMFKKSYTDTQTWGQRRNAFIKRHMAQYKKNPTRRRWLALAMWAYKPPGTAPK